VFNAHQLDTNKDVQSAKPVTPMPDKGFTSVGDMAFTNENSVNFKGLEALWEKVKQEYTFTYGQLCDENDKEGIPVYRYNCYELDDQELQNLESKKTAVLAVLEKRLKSKDAPTKLSTDALQELMRGFSQVCHDAKTNKELVQGLDAQGKACVEKAVEDFENDFLLSTKKCLERKTGKGYKLKNREIAELILVRAAEKAAGDTVENGGLNVSPDKYDKFVTSMTNQLGNLDQSKLQDVDKLVNAGVALMVKDKDFVVKSKAKKGQTGHVSIKGADSDKKWLKKLLVVAQ
jgi:hypothetical protein